MEDPTKKQLEQGQPPPTTEAAPAIPTTPEPLPLPTPSKDNPSLPASNPTDVAITGKLDNITEHLFPKDKYIGYLLRDNPQMLKPMYELHEKNGSPGLYNDADLTEGELMRIGVQEANDILQSRKNIQTEVEKFIEKDTATGIARAMALLAGFFRHIRPDSNSAIYRVNSTQYQLQLNVAIADTLEKTFVDWLKTMPKNATREEIVSAWYKRAYNIIKFFFRPRPTTPTSLVQPPSEIKKLLRFTIDAGLGLFIPRKKNMRIGKDSWTATKPSKIHPDNIVGFHFSNNNTRKEMYFPGYEPVAPPLVQAPKKPQDLVASVLQLGNATIDGVKNPGTTTAEPGAKLPAIKKAEAIVKTVHPSDVALLSYMKMPAPKLVPVKAEFVPAPKPIDVDNDLEESYGLTSEQTGVSKRGYRRLTLGELQSSELPEQELRDFRFRYRDPHKQAQKAAEDQLKNVRKEAAERFSVRAPDPSDKDDINGPFVRGIVEQSKALAEQIRPHINPQQAVAAAVPPAVTRTTRVLDFRSKDLFIYRPGDFGILVPEKKKKKKKKQAKD
jgi:hypothetical protein